MKVMIIAMLVSALAGAAAGFFTTLYILRRWVDQEQRRHDAIRAARRDRAERRKEERSARRGPAASREEKAPVLKVITLERPAEKRGHIRGAYRGPDGTVTLVGLEGGASFGGA